MKILHYTQYVFGVGHLFRSMAIDRALAPLTVDLVTGGAGVPIPMPDNVRHHAMPALRMDENYGRILTVDEDGDLENTWNAREAMLLELFRDLDPDVLLIEMFPFGRRLFSRELLPLLAANRSRPRPAVTLCSVRDILVEKKDPAKFEKRVLGWLNPWFDGVLVHADPDLVRLDRTFSRTADIACPVWYTGYVAEGPGLPDKASARAALGMDADETIILASAGSGTIIRDLLDPIMEACILLNERLPHRLLMFTGPNAPADEVRRLAERGRDHPGAVVEEFTSRFPDHVLACDLSVSRGGYNTTMNLLACGARGLMHPYGHDREQRMRLEALSALGHVGLLEDADLESARLSGLMEDALRREHAPSRPLRLEGDRESADIIRRLAAGRGSTLL
jgi:predicted glycosyltransferase